MLAPHGLDDLMQLIVRPNLAFPGAESVYLRRLEAKGWQRRWPKLTVLDLPHRESSAGASDAEERC